MLTRCCFHQDELGHFLRATRRDIETLSKRGNNYEVRIVASSLGENEH